MKEKIVERILVDLEKGYDSIAEKFSQTRNKFWRDLEFIKDYCNNEDKILDYGCGNGRLLDLFDQKSVDYTGVDISRKLIAFARNRYTKENARFLKLSPGQNSITFDDNFFNAVYSVAVFHHLPSTELRSEIAREMHRVLKPGGYVVITVWNLWQPRYRKNIFQNQKNKLLRKSELDWGDCWVNFTDNSGKVFQRFHHAFTKKSLEKLFVNVGFDVIRCEVIGSNIVLIAKKQAK